MFTFRPLRRETQAQAKEVRSGSRARAKLSGWRRAGADVALNLLNRNEFPKTVAVSDRAERRVDVRPITRACAGLFVRRLRWGLSLRGWSFAFALLVASGYLFVANIYKFLAVTDRVQSDTLVVEGWVHEYAVSAAVAEFRRGNYHQVFTTGGPVTGKGGYVNDFQTAASVGAELLKREGIPAERVQMIPSHVIGRDRTYSSAVALRDWLRAHHLEIGAINIVTEDVHARRTRFLFEKALGPQTRVGIIAVGNVDYNASHWWRYSEGIEAVINEMIGYLYTGLLFPFIEHEKERTQVKHSAMTSNAYSENYLAAK